MMNAIEFKDAVYEYPAGGHALDGVNAGIKKGEFVAVIGHNGSGKSTLAKHINALFVPTGGRVLVLGLDTSKPENVMDVRRHAGMVFQNPDNQMVTTIIEEDVAFGPENLGVPSAQIRTRVDSALKAVGMFERAKSAPHDLSGGQKQRVALAGILAMKPDIIVLDEPTAMLDPQGRREVLETVTRLNREEGITIVLITHFMEEAAMADTVIVMDRGKPKLTGTPEEVFARADELREIGLEAPFTARLCAELNERGVKVGMTLDEDALVEELCR